MTTPVWSEDDVYCRFWRKAQCTFLHCHWLWPLVFPNETAYEKALNAGVGPHLLRSLRYRFAHWVWFWPQLFDAQIWADQALVGTHYSPAKYTEMEDTDHVLVDEIASHAKNKDASLLDLGCNCGRFLNALAQRDFGNLHGVDIGRAALEHMRAAFPRLSGKVRTYNMTLQQFLSQSETGQFDLTYTRGATIELIHPSFPLIREICRVTRECVVLFISENGHAYPRFWAYEFQRNGFILTKLNREIHKVSLMVFHRKDSTGSNSANSTE